MSGNPAAIKGTCANALRHLAAEAVKDAPPPTREQLALIGSLLGPPVAQAAAAEDTAASGAA